MENKLNIKLGIITFIIGIILLIITFIIGYNFMTNQANYISKNLIENDFIKYFSNWFMKSSTVIVILFIMTIIGSCLTNKGLTLLLTKKK